jgi:hypothetical protein
MVDPVLHKPMLLDDMQDALGYPGNLNVPTEAEAQKLELPSNQQDIPLEALHMEVPSLTEVKLSSEPLVVVSGPSISEPAKNFMLNNAFSVALNTSLVIAMKNFQFAQKNTKLAYITVAEIFDSAMKSLGVEYVNYYKEAVSEKFAAKLNYTESYRIVEFGKKELATIGFKIIRQGFLDVGAHLAVAVKFASQESLISDWPQNIKEIILKRLVKDFIQDFFIIPYVDGKIKPYTDLRIGAIFSDIFKALAVGYALKGNKDSIEKLASISIAKYAIQWWYNKYFKDYVYRGVDYLDNWSGLKESHPICGRYAKALASSAITTIFLTAFRVRVS